MSDEPVARWVGDEETGHLELPPPTRKPSIPARPLTSRLELRRVEKTPEELERLRLEVEAALGKAERPEVQTNRRYRYYLEGFCLHDSSGLWGSKDMPNIVSIVKTGGILHRRIDSNGEIFWAQSEGLTWYGQIKWAVILDESEIEYPPLHPEDDQIQ